MLGPTQFQFETPNVIDEGDAPPCPPRRVSLPPPASTPSSSTTHTNNTNEDDDTDYHTARESATRLLHDIQDLELTQFHSTSSTGTSTTTTQPNNNKSSHKLSRSERLPFRDFPNRAHSTTNININNTNIMPYDPYDEEEDDSNNNNHHSLPNSAEESRWHAQTLMGGGGGGSHNPHPRRSKTPTWVGRTLQLFAPSPSSPLRRRNHPSSTAHNHMHPDSHSYCGWLRDCWDEVWYRYCSPRRRGLMICLSIAVIFLLVFGVVWSVGGSNTNSHARRPLDPARLAALIQVMVDRGVSTHADLTSTTSSTPQSKAIQWLATDDALQYDVRHPRLVQRYVLAVFFFATGGDTSSSSSSWRSPMQFVSNLDECAWNEEAEMPTYLTKTMAVGAACNGQFEVATLFVPNNGLTGRLPSELAHLPSLTLLGVPDNALTGPLPASLSGSLLHLLYFNINRNRITGTIPAYVGDWADLQVLGLADNELTGSVPASLGTAARLKTISLSNNKMLNGTLNFVAHLPVLRYLYASHNRFTGSLGDSFLSLVGDLRELDISYNNLSGDLSLYMLLQEHELHILDVSHNNFTGPFPELTDSNLALRYLNLHSNNLTGPLPESLHLLEKLEYLDLTDNLFSGPIPNNGLGGCKSLKSLSLSGNHFDTGDDMLPPLNQLTKLRELSLSRLGLTLTIPIWLKFLKKLQVLDLSHNSLTGSIPEVVWNLTNLHSLLLNDNQLSGKLPSSRGQNISLLAVHHNDIEDANFASSACHHVANHSVVATVDCSVRCTATCCGECCKEDDDVCSVVIREAYKGGYNYTAAALAFDPDILDEAGQYISPMEVDDSIP